jgi:hypothetical protein
MRLAEKLVWKGLNIRVGGTKRNTLGTKPSNLQQNLTMYFPFALQHTVVWPAKPG